MMAETDQVNTTEVVTQKICLVRVRSSSCMRWRSPVMDTSFTYPCTLPNKHTAHWCRASCV